MDPPTRRLGQAARISGRKQVKVEAQRSMNPVRRAEEPVRLFKDQSAWTAWLVEHHRNSTGIWLRLAKKGSGLHSVSRSEALDTALCYGWIDGQAKPENDETWLQRFVPRSDKSI